MSNLYQVISESLSAIDLSGQPQGLYAPIAYALETGGKRMRPLLALTASDMFGGKREDILPAAMALEVFHNFTLLHDDLMDNADTRRGRPSVHKKWNRNTAILSGDQMLIEAYKQLQRLPEHVMPKCLELFNKMATEICEGQQYDMEFEHRSDVTLEEYITMIRLKTAVLPATALRMGALTAGAGEAEQEDMYNIGINIGLAFQLRDDYLDVYGDPLTFGKAIGGDIIDKKKTYLYITALNKADTSQKQQFEYWFNSNDNQAKITNISRLYSETGADAECLKDIGHYHLKAINTLGSLNVSQQAKMPLQQIIQQLLNREK